MRRNAASDSDDDTDGLGYPTGSRSSFEQRQNARDDVDEQAWRDHEYPLTAKRKAEEREEKRQQWEELREQSKQNYARHTDQ